MKKWIIYMIISMIIIMSIVSIVLLISIYRNTSNTQIDGNDKFAETQESSNISNSQVVTTSYASVKVSPNANIILKTYYKECEHTVIKEDVANSDIVNKNEYEIQEYYKDWDIKKFTQGEVILYKEVDGKCMEHYVIREKDGYVNVFNINQDGKEELIETTLVAVQYLPETDLINLKQGIEVYGLEEVNRIIEDFE